MKKKINLLLFFFTLFTIFSFREVVHADDTHFSDIDPTQKVVHVKTADEFIDAYLKPYDQDYNPNRDQSGTSNIQKIIVDNDINLNTSSYTRYFDHYVNRGGSSHYDYYYMKVNHVNGLVIDGQNHTIDFGRSNIALLMADQNWTFENMTAYGVSYYGPLSINNPNNTITYKNFTYYGSQLVHTSGSQGSKVNLEGNVNINSVPYYKPMDTKYDYKGLNKDGTIDTISNGQQNMEVSDVEVMPNTTYTGTTYKDTVLELAGNLKIDDGATMNLNPHNYGNSEHGLKSDGWAGSYRNSAGIYFTDKNAKLDTGKNAKLNINVDRNDVKTNAGISIPPNKDNYNTIAVGLYSYYAANINLSNNSQLNVNGDGIVGTYNTTNTNSKPLVYLGEAKLNVYKGSKVDIEQKSDNPQGYSSNGVLDSDAATVNIDQGGSLSLQTFLENSKNRASVIFQLGSKGSIKFTNPKEVIFNTNNDKTNSNIFKSSSTSTINATDFSYSFDSVNKEEDDDSLKNNEKVPIKRMILPISGVTLGFNNGGIFSGSYTNIKKMFNSFQKNSLGKQPSKMQFTSMPKPYLSIDDQSNDTELNDNGDALEGHVKDEDGNPLKNAYIRIFVDKSSTDSKDFFNKYSNDNIWNLINYQQVLYNKRRKFFPDEGKTYTSGKSFNTKQTLKGSDFVTDNNTDETAFNEAISPFQKTFNTYSTLNEKYKPFYTMTDENGNFKVNLSQELWQYVGSDSANLNVLASYNYYDSDIYKIKLKSLMKLKVSTSMTNLTNNDSNVTDNKLVDVNQGDADSSESSSGDRLRFATTFTNSSTHVDYKYDYKQPVPLSADLSTLRINVDGKYKKVEDTDYSYEVENTNDYKILKFKNLTINRAKDDKPTTKDFNLRVSLSDPDKKYNSDDINFNSEAISNSGESVKGPDSSISFLKPQGITIEPRDINFNINNVFNSDLLYYPSNMNGNEAVKIEDKRRNRTPVTLTVQQNNKKFISQTNPNNFFEGNLLYKNDNRYSSILNKPVEIASTKSGESLSNYYWSKNNVIVLSPETNFGIHGNYSNGDKTKDNPGLTWTITNGIT